jgi:hypothetical protein
LIGNAVPPRLAEAFGRSLFRDYRPSQVNEILSTGGKLLTFSPTLSAGMSPILTEIVVHVKKRYGVGTGDMMQAQLPLYA